MINLIQLQTGADPGHRFYYHSAWHSFSHPRSADSSHSAEKEGLADGDGDGDSIDFGKYRLDSALIGRERLRRAKKNWDTGNPRRDETETESSAQGFTDLL